jgi:hypothetical protein
MILDGKMTLTAMRGSQQIDSISYGEGEQLKVNKFINDYKGFADKMVVTFKIQGQEKPIEVVARYAGLGEA